MNPRHSLVGRFVAPMHEAGIEYMVTGGLAAIAYGHPRLTLDIDVVVRLRARDVRAFAALWPGEEYYCPPIEVIQSEVERREHGHFNVIHNESAMRADVYLAGDDAFHSWALEHRVARTIEETQVQFAPIEYVIVYKLLYFRMGGSDRHLRDIARMLQISSGESDRGAIERWVDHFGLAAEWDRALRTGED